MKRYSLLVLAVCLVASSFSAAQKAAQKKVPTSLNVHATVGTMFCTLGATICIGSYLPRIPIRMTVSVVDPTTGLGPSKSYSIFVHWLDDPATTLPDAYLPVGGQTPTRQNLCHPPTDVTVTGLNAGSIYNNLD